MVRSAGSGYTLKIVARDLTGYVVASIITPAFTVYVGSVFQLQFHSYVSSAIGGTPFKPSPSVAVVDRGGNIVSTYNGGSCRISLSMTPTGVEQLQPISNTYSTFQYGISQFDGLSINASGFPYELLFNASSAQVSVIQYSTR